ncbi:S-protein-like protein 2 [Bienertia sinuspersici]
MLIILMLNVSMSEAGLVEGLGLVEKRDARVINALAQGKDLIVHCRTKDEDFGKQTLKYGKYADFKVTEKTEDIVCGFDWDKKVHVFEIFNVNKYKEECGERCWWMIKETGACLFDMESKAHIYCYSFKGEKN